MRAIIIGAQGTGKTALFRRLTGLPQKDDDLPTHGILQTPHPIQLDGEHGPLLLDLLEISDEPRFMPLYALSAPDIAVLVYNTGSSKTSRRATELLFGQLRAHLDHRLPFLFVENENPSAVVVTEEIAKRMTAWTSKLSERYGRPLIKLILKTGEGEAFLRAQLYIPHLRTGAMHPSRSHFHPSNIQCPSTALIGATWRRSKSRTPLHHRSSAATSQSCQAYSCARLISPLCVYDDNSGGVLCTSL